MKFEQQYNYVPEFINFSQEKISYLLTSYLFLMKTGFSLFNFYVIFLMQSCAFIKLLSFGSNLKKKNAKINLEILIFHLKMDFYK